MVSPDAQDPLPSFRDPLQRIALIVTALAGSAVAAPPVAAQEAWTGGVEVSTSSLTVVEGGSVTYSLRLTEPPTADGWWIMVHVDGSRRHAGEYGGIRWVPSLGWEFNQDNWNQWRDIHIQALDDNVLEGDRSLTFTHEVWDHNADCPVKGASPVTVRVTDKRSRRRSLAPHRGRVGERGGDGGVCGDTEPVERTDGDGGLRGPKAGRRRRIRTTGRGRGA